MSAEDHAGHESLSDELIAAEIETENCTGRRIIRTPADGVAAMKKRIDYLQRQLAAFPDNIDHLRDLNTARACLADYESRINERN